MSDVHDATAPDALAPRLIDRFGVKEILAILAVVGLIAGMLLFWYKPPGDSNQVLVSLIGVLSAIVMLVYNHYFGSTTQSRTKDETIAKQAAALAPGARL